MRKPCERVYLAACPFCDYRELFSSAVAMLAIYGSHLLGHEDEAHHAGQTGRAGTARRMDRLAHHLQRLNTAQYN